MSYVINYSGGTITIPLNTANTTATPLTLIGRNWTSANAQQGFGQALNQNFVSLLENFANTVQPSSPLTGQFWYDISSNQIRINNGTPSAPVWATLSTSGSTAVGIVNGSTAISIPVINGNLAMTVGGVSNVMVLTNTGANVNGYVAATTIQSSNITTGANTTAGTMTGTWTLTAGSSLQSTYADLAEYYTIDKSAGAATVVEFGGSAEIRVCHTPMSRAVAGVVSTNPAFIMNDDGEFKGQCREAVALQGRVPCKVIGPVSKGDLMVSAGQFGAAMRCDDPVSGSIIGKALEDKSSDDLAIIEIAVGRL